LNDVIESAVNDPNTSFQLDVYCTDVQSRRSLTIFHGTVGVWNGERQVRLHADDRRALLQLLHDAGFASFEARYGGQKKADKQEAPLRVTCRVYLELAGREKTSIQLLEGEQSSELIGLAGGLLDVVEPRAANGVVAATLDDGLAKIADGVLAPEIIELRLLQLPKDTTARPGSILRIRGGNISRQPYAPGKLVGEVDSSPLDACVTREVVAALIDARAWDLPRNLRREGTTELDVGVLGSRVSVLARSSFRNAEADAQARFERMIDRLEGLQAECPDDL